jgi:hypothetical protein
MYGLNPYSEDTYPQYAYNYPFYGYGYGYGYPSFYPTAEWLSYPNYYQNYYPNYYQNYYQNYQYNYMVNNFNHLAANYNQLLVENKYSKNDTETPSSSILLDENRVADIVKYSGRVAEGITDSPPIREYSKSIPQVEPVTTPIVAGERPTQKSRDICISALGSSKEFTDKSYEGVLHSLVYTPDTAKNSGREAEGVRGNSGERSSKEFLDAPTEITVIQPDVAPAEDMILTYDTFYTMDTYYTFDTYDEIIPN